MHFTTENWWFFGEKEIYTMGRIVPWGAELRAVWRTLANKLKKIVILIDEKKRKKYETRGNAADFMDFL